MNNEKRNVKIEIAKALGIIAIVVSHSWRASPFYTFLFLFHVPIFFFLSGYLYKDKYSNDIFSLVKQKIKKLYLPFIKYGLAFLLFHNIFFRLNLYDNNSILPLYEGDLVGRLYTGKEYIANIFKILTFGETEILSSPLWFLVSLFTVNILFGIISYFIMHKIKNPKINHEHARMIIIFCIFIIGNLIILSDIIIPRRINGSLVALAIFYLGYLYNKLEKFINLKTKHAIIFTFILLIGSSLLLFYTDMQGNIYSPLFLLSTILGIYIVLYLSEAIVKQKIALKILSYIGQNSLPIMILHLLSFKAVSFIIILLYKYPMSRLADFPFIWLPLWWIIYSIAGIFIPLLFVFIVDKFKIVVREKTKIS